MTKKKMQLLVTAKLGGPSWWRYKFAEEPGGYWYWDGKKSLYWSRGRFIDSQFTPGQMLRMGTYFILVEDPR